MKLPFAIRHAQNPRLSWLVLLAPVLCACSFFAPTVDEFASSVHDSAGTPPAVNAPPSCRDGQLSPGEADIDCGLACSSPCSSGHSCMVDLDCSSALCASGVCIQPTCTDGLKDQQESDIDCGGDTSCPRCETGGACLSPADCNEVACTGGRCAAASCNDGLKNQTESDTDCGGACPSCSIGQNCSVNQDCGQALCTTGKCRPLSCADQLKDQNETDVDCGGTDDCARCATGQHCAVAGDCNHAACSAGLCQPTSCNDGVQNGTETSSDCGGSCPACADGASCAVATDCLSHVCTPGTLRCAAPTCTDRVLNGSELATDCGGTCPQGCNVGDPCVVNGGCASGQCLNGACVAGPSDTPLPTVGWVASASASYTGTDNGGPITTFAPRLGVDGNPSTHWTVGDYQVPGMWFEVDMRTPQVFYSLTLTSLTQPTDFAKNFKISGSLDGRTFTVLRTNIAGSKSQKVSFTTPQSARYIKLELLQATNLWWRIDELVVLE